MTYREDGILTSPSCGAGDMPSQGVSVENNCINAPGVGENAAPGIAGKGDVIGTPPNPSAKMKTTKITKE